MAAPHKVTVSKQLLSPLRIFFTGDGFMVDGTDDIDFHSHGLQTAADALLCFLLLLT